MKTIQTKLMKSIKLPQAKLCTNEQCKTIHIEIPAGSAALWVGDDMDGLYWNCDCGTTKFVRRQNLNEAEVVVA